MAVKGLDVDVDAPAGSVASANELPEWMAGYPSREDIADGNFASMASSANGGAHSPRAGIQVGGAARFHEAVHWAFADAQKTINVAIESAKLRVAQSHNEAFGMCNESPGRHSDQHLAGFLPSARFTSQLSVALAAVAAEGQEARRTSFWANLAPKATRWMQASIDGQGRQDSKDGPRWRSVSKDSTTSEQAGSPKGSGGLQPRQSVQRMSLRDPDSAFMGPLSPFQQPPPFTMRSAFARQGSLMGTAAFHKQDSLHFAHEVSMRNRRGSASSAGTANSLKSPRSARAKTLRVELGPGFPELSASPAVPPPEIADPPTAKASVSSVRATSRPALPSEDPPPPPPAATSMEPSRSMAREEDSPRHVCEAESSNMAAEEGFPTRVCEAQSLKMSEEECSPTLVCKTQSSKLAEGERSPTLVCRARSSRTVQVCTAVSSKTFEDDDSSMLVCKARSSKLVQVCKALSSDTAEGESPPMYLCKAQSSILSGRSGTFSQGSVARKRTDSRKNLGAPSDACARRNSAGAGHLISVMATKQFDIKSVQEARRTLWFSSASCKYAFNVTIGIAVILNSVAVGASADTADWWAWPFIDMVFAAVFTVEMFVKMRFGGIMKYFIGRGFHWNLFDFVLVVLAWTDIGMTFKNNAERGSTVLDALRNLRVARAARVLRVSRLSVFADLAMMVNGAVYGMKTFLWSQVVLAVPLYIVALLLRNSLGDSHSQGSGAEYFNTLVLSYFTSFRCLVANECFSESGQPIFLLITKNFGWCYAVLYMFMNVLMTFALGNIIVAIFVENTLATAKANDLRKKQQRLTDSKMFHRKALELVDLIYEHLAPIKDVNWDSPDLQALMEEAMKVHLSREVFDELVQLERFQKLLHDMDINVAEQLDLFDTLDVDGGGTIDLEELLTGIHRLRGDARRSDIVGTALRVSAIQEYLVGFEAVVNQQFAVLRTALNVPEDAGVDGADA